MRLCLPSSAEVTGQRPPPIARPQARGWTFCFTVHGSWEWAENDADSRGSFAAVERSMSDRLLRMKCLVSAMSYKNPS